MDTEQFSAPVVCDQQDHISRSSVDSLLDVARESATRRTDARIQEGVITALRNLVKEGELYSKYATEAYNAIAEQVGWDIRDSIAATYLVTVHYDGDEVLRVEGVEADSEEEATSKVLENVEVSNVVMSFTISYGSDEESVESAIWDDSEIIDAIDAEAVEE